MGEAKTSDAKKGGASVFRGLVFAGLGGVSWGFSGACVQLLTSSYGLTVPWLICVRLAFGAAFFLTIAFITSRDKLFGAFKDAKMLALMLAYTLFGVLMPQVCYLTTISYTNAGVATVMERMGLVLVLAYTCIRLHRGPKKSELFGLFLALAGVFLLCTDGKIGNLALPIEGLVFGSLLAVALLFYTVLPVKLLHEWGNAVTTGLSMSVAVIIVNAVFRPWNIEVTLTPDAYFYIGLFILFGTIASYGFFMQGIKEAGSMRAGLMGCTEPISATAFSALWLGTSFTPPAMTGMVFIIVMMFFIRDTGE